MLIKVTQFLQQPNTKLKHLSEQGFTLVESLMAMVVISIVVVAMTPPIFLAVGTRVQNRRAEQAMQLAQGEIDRIRVLVEQGNYVKEDLPAVPATLPTNFKDVAAPTSIASSPNYIKSLKTCSSYNSYTGKPPIDTNKVLRVDTNSDCKFDERDFLVQTFRDVGQPVQTLPTDPPPIAFRMGVRVYAAVAEQNVANLQRERAPLQFTTGLGSQRSRPLAVIYTKIVRSDLGSSFGRYNDLLK